MTEYDSDVQEYSGEHPWHDGRLLRDLYIGRGMSMPEIADKLGCSDSTVSQWVRRHGIETRYSERIDSSTLQNKALLQELYLDKRLTTEEIGERLGCAGWTVARWLKKHGIAVRSHGNGQGPDELKDAEWLHTEYVEEQRSTVEISQELGCSAAAVGNRLQEYGVPLRAPAERTGPLAGSWKGGHDRYYGPDWDKQRRKALKRDAQGCQRCGLSMTAHKQQHGEELHVHHIQRKAGFDTHAEANRLDNLITLCRVCHSMLEGLPIDHRSE